MRYDSMKSELKDSMFHDLAYSTFVLTGDTSCMNSMMFSAH